MIPTPFHGSRQLLVSLLVAGTISGLAAPGGDALPTMPERSRVVAVFDATAGEPVAQGWKEKREGKRGAVTAESKDGAWWITDSSNGLDGLTYGLDISPQDQTALKQGWVLEMAVDLRESDTPKNNRNLPRTTCDVRILHEEAVLHHLTFALTPDGDHGTRPYSRDICGIEHRHQAGDKVQFEMKPSSPGKGHEFTMRIGGTARQFITPAADSPSVPTRIEWGSPASDGTSRAGWRQVILHQADWQKLDLGNQTALDAVSPAQVALETGWHFSLPFPVHRLEDNLLGTPPMAAVGEKLVVCAPAYVPSDTMERLIFVVSHRNEPMTTGLYWYMHYGRGTGELNQIIVMDQSGDEWLQDPAFKRSGEARPGESAPALIKRYREEMIRRTEANPSQSSKKSWVETSAAYALTLDKLWSRHRQALSKTTPTQ